MSRTLSALFGLFVLPLSPTTADAARVVAGQMQTVGNVVIYLGLLPAEMIRGHPQEHPEATMHGGTPSRSGEYHVLVSLFDAKTSERITNVEVLARVSEIGLAEEQKKLEPMKIAGTITYGNYFGMTGNGPFRIRLTIQVLGQPEEITAEFEHRHQ